MIISFIIMDDNILPFTIIDHIEICYIVFTTISVHYLNISKCYVITIGC